MTSKLDELGVSLTYTPTDESTSVQEAVYSGFVVVDQTAQFGNRLLQLSRLPSTKSR